MPLPLFLYFTADVRAITLSGSDPSLQAVRSSPPSFRRRKTPGSHLRSGSGRAAPRFASAPLDALASRIDSQSPPSAVPLCLAPPIFAFSKNGGPMSPSPLEPPSFLPVLHSLPSAQVWQ